MKITRTRLNKIIKEEIESVMSEVETSYTRNAMRRPVPGAADGPTGHQGGAVPQSDLPKKEEIEILWKDIATKAGISPGLNLSNIIGAFMGNNIYPNMGQANFDQTSTIRDLKLNYPNEMERLGFD